MNHNDLSLGFSDLGEDEALVVWLYRSWQDHGPTRAIAEHRIAVLLRADRLHRMLGSVFEVYRALGRDPDFLASGRATLTPQELRLLRLLAAEAPASLEASSCRAALATTGVSLRDPARIPRSGRDRLEMAVADSYAATIRTGIIGSCRAAPRARSDRR